MIAVDEDKVDGRKVCGGILAACDRPGLANPLNFAIACAADLASGDYALRAETEPADRIGIDTDQ
jgi:hypothetical protein